MTPCVNIPTMSLCLVVSSLRKPGGAEKSASLMANFWASKGRQVTVVTLDDDSSPLFYELDPRIRHLPLGLTSESRNLFAAIANNFRRVLAIRRAIRAAGANVVISFMTATNVLVLLACSNLPVRVVACERSVPDLLPLPRSWKILSRLTYPRAFRVVVQSQRAAHSLLPRLRDTLRIVPNPVLVPAREKDLRWEPTLRVIAVGRFTEEKCFMSLINAFARVCAKHPSWTLTIYGDGPLRPELEEVIERFQLEKRVYLPGTVKNPIDQLLAADVFVLSSRFEGFPNALAEAMAVGLPVIATDCPGAVAELVRNEIDGILVRVNDEAAMASALDRLMADPVERNRLGARGREVTSRFDLHRIMSRWDELLFPRSEL